MMPRVVPIPLLSRLKVELKRLEKLRVIEQMNEPTEWCSLILCVLKKDANEVSLCCDCTELNKGLERPIYPVPKVEVTLASLNKARFFHNTVGNRFTWIIIDGGR